MAWPTRGQRAPDFWDNDLKMYVDNADAVVQANIATAVAALVNSAPSTLDTLKELADALGDDPNFATTVAASIGAVNTKIPEIVIPAPTGVVATDDAAIAAAITAAGSRGVIKGVIGDYAINSHHVIPNGVDLQCMGGGSTSKSGATKFKCMTAGAQIEIAGGGGLSGGFEVDGNSIATTPFKRSGGTGANARLFENITVRNNAPASQTNDLALFLGAQNDLWIQCGWAGADRDARVFDQGYGGAYFLRCEVSVAGRYHDHYDDAVAGGPYASPSDIKHVGGICEGTSGISIVKVDAGGLIAYNDHAFYSINGCSGPMFDVDGLSTTVVAIDDPYFQNTPSTLVAGSIAVRANTPSSVVITGRAYYLNFETATQVNGGVAFIYDKSIGFFFNTTNPQGAAGGATVNQIMSLSQGPTLVVAQTAVSTFAFMTQNQARSVQRFGIKSSGDIQWFPGTNFVHDVQIGRRAVGAAGVELSTQQIWCIGAGTTAQRPAAAAALAGGIYLNTDTKTIDACDGTAWIVSHGRWNASLIGLAEPPVVLSAGVWSYTVSTYGFPASGGVVSPTVSATWYADVAVGSYKTTLVLLESNNSGFIDVDYSLDGGTNWTNLHSGIDLYSASNVVRILTSAAITVATPGRIDFRIKNTGVKNASSSAYFYIVSEASLQRVS